MLLNRQLPSEAMCWMVPPIAASCASYSRSSLSPKRFPFCRCFFAALRAARSSPLLFDDDGPGPEPAPRPLRTPFFPLPILWRLTCVDGNGSGCVQGMGRWVERGADTHTRAPPTTALELVGDVGDHDHDVAYTRIPPTIPWIDRARLTPHQPHTTHTPLSTDKPAWAGSIDRPRRARCRPCWHRSGDLPPLSLPRHPETRWRRYPPL